jgi:23S rRNA (adenine2503-C2)-methyltransferase
MNAPVKSLDVSFSNRPDAAGPIPLAGLTRAQLRDALIEHAGVEEKKAKMRAEQLWRWIYHYGVQSFDEMTNVSKDLRKVLSEKFTLARAEIVERLVSVDGTRKYLIRFAPGVEGETVFIPDVGKSGALCVSSQVGCTLNCTFCHTGTQKLVRNLTAAEIAQQVMIARDDLGEWPTSNEDRQITNIVFMGMGEPLYNLDNVSDAIDVISDGDGIAIGRRRITVSTSGVVPKIPELGERTRRCWRSACTPRTTSCATSWCRSTRNTISQTLMDAIRAYPDLSNAKRVTFEYVMLKGVNDTGRSPRAGQAAEGRAGQDQPDPVQSLAEQPL